MENELAAWEGSVTVGKTHPGGHHHNDYHDDHDYQDNHHDNHDDYIGDNCPLVGIVGMTHSENHHIDGEIVHDILHAYIQKVSS